MQLSTFVGLRTKAAVSEPYGAGEQLAEGLATLPLPHQQREAPNLVL